MSYYYYIENKIIEHTDNKGICKKMLHFGDLLTIIWLISS